VAGEDSHVIGKNRAWWRSGFSILLGAALGMFVVSFGRIDTYYGLTLQGDNEWTPFLTFAGAIGGASLAAVERIRQYAAIPIGASCGLAIGMIIRDRIQLQPLFGDGISGTYPNLKFYETPGDATIIGLMAVTTLAGALVGWLLLRRSRADGAGPRA